MPESIHQDTVGTFARTIKDSVHALDAIYGIDKHDNYTKRQQDKTPPKGYSQFVASKDALKGATFGLPWDSFWVLLDEVQRTSLLELVDLIKDAGASMVNGTELPDYESIVSPDGWDWYIVLYNTFFVWLMRWIRDYGATRGFANESEFTAVKVCMPCLRIQPLNLDRLTFTTISKAT